MEQVTSSFLTEGHKYYRGVNLRRGPIGSRNKSDHGQLNDKYDVYVSYMKLL